MTSTAKPRPLIEDLLRALGYANLMAWAVIFTFFPPSAFLSEVAYVSRTLWLGVAFVGAAMALAGAVLRIDIKLEFPGLLLALIGPFFYFVSQFYLAAVPLPDVDPTQRFALVAYALLPVTLLLPRTVSLLSEKNRLKGLSK